MSRVRPLPVDDDPTPRADDELVDAARAGDDVAVAELLTRYRGLARSKARTYFIAGADRDDVLQEAMVGLYKAVRDFRPDRGCSFRTFADLCITRQVITAIKSANRRKHDPLRACVSLDAPAGRSTTERPTLVGDLLPAGAHTDPAAQALSAASIRDLERHLAGVLSDLEVEVLRLLVDGCSYEEIATAVGRHTKAVDNAIQRLRRKIGDHLSARAI